MFHKMENPAMIEEVQVYVTLQSCHLAIAVIVVILLLGTSFELSITEDKMQPTGLNTG